MTPYFWIGLVITCVLHTPLDAQSPFDVQHAPTAPHRPPPFESATVPLRRFDVAPLRTDLVTDTSASWDYPLAGAVIGAVAGGLWGGWIARSNDYVGPPPYLFTVPVGAAAGFVAGLLVRGK